jgi:Tfp pilus assembly protein PilZ
LSPPERRRLRRHRKGIPARFQCGLVRGWGYVRNLTEDGMFLNAEQLPKVNSEITLTLESPTGEKVEVGGRVIWTTAELPASKAAIPGFGVSVKNGIRAYRQFFESLLLSS